MRFHILHIVLIMGFGGMVYGQMLPLLDQYHVNGLAINPAYAGSQSAITAELCSRRQWVGFEGAPRTLTFSVHSPLRNRKVNLGVIVMSDRYGSSRETGLMLNYAFRMDLGSAKLSLGLAAGIAGRTTDMNSMRYIDSGDLLLEDPNRRAYLPDFSFGTYYHSDRFYIGLSMPLFLSHSLNEGSGRFKTGFHPSESNYMLTGGYCFRLSEDFEILPSCLVRSVPVNNTQLDVSLSTIFREKLWLRFSVRTNGNISAIIQMQVNQQFRIGYAYGYEISELSNYQQGSHEIILAYSFNYLLEVMGPRYF